MTRPDTIRPILFYDDLAGILPFLQEAFGFVKRFQFPDEGAPQYAEVTYDGGVIMLGSTKTPSPHGRLCNPREAGSWSQSVYVLVEDADEHHGRASAAGAEILDPPCDAH